MTAKKILIITDKSRAAGQFASPPFSLPIEKFTATGPASLNYMGLQQFAAVVIDCGSLHPHLTKISLGIRDTTETEALWHVFCGSSGARVFILVDRKSAPGKEMRELGIDYILAGELAELTQQSTGPVSEKTDYASNHDFITADEIREMHQNGIRTISESRPITSWAAEVAESLGMKIAADNLKLLADFSRLSPSKILNQRSDFFNLASRFNQDLFFVLNPLVIPVFAQVCPSLREKVVASTIHWAHQGAFTGETSAAMLADLRCHGAIIPAFPPYCQPQNLQDLLKQAKKHNLELFSTFTLASGTGCDIIATDVASSLPLTPLYDARLFDQSGLPATGAIIAENDYLMQLPFRKG